MSEHVFVPKEPCSEVRDFLARNSKPCWKEALGFLIECFPQRDGNHISYLIEGGTALYLLYPGQRPLPRDVDLITGDQRTAAKFVNSRVFDAKAPREWFACRGITYVPSLDRELFDGHQSVLWGGREVVIPSVEILALSKMAIFQNRALREQDMRDFELLGVCRESAEEMVVNFHTRWQQS